MKRKNMARNALFTSIISLLLCVSMLVGTTFAWFTDEVTTGMNTIAAGNLDVELLADGQNVTSSTKLFDDVTLWEPGAVAYENLQVVNAGTLALNYKLSLNVENATANDEGQTLADVLKVAVVDGGFTGNRTDAHSLTNYQSLATFTRSGFLEGSTTSKTYGIVIYWEPDTDYSDANGNYDNNFNVEGGLEIDLGINLFATQEMYEDDSFGEDYDGPATNQAGDPLPKATVTASPEYVNTPLPWGSYGQWSPNPALEANLEGAYTFTCPDTAAEAAASPYADWYCDFYLKLDRDLGENQIFLGGNYGTFGWIGFHNGDVTLPANQELALLGSVTSKPWTYQMVADNVGTFICGAGDVNDALTGATLTVMLRLTNPEDEAEFYNVSTVTLTFTDGTDSKIYTAADLAAAVAAGGEVILGSDIVLTDTVTVPAGVSTTLNMNGHTISQTKACTESYQMIGNDGTLVITGNGKLSFTDSGAGDPDVGWASYTVRNSGTLTVENGTIEHLGTQTYNGNNAIFHYAGTTIINGGTISAPYSRSLRVWHGSATINGGSFDGQVWAQPVDDNGCSLTINGGSFKPATHGGDGSSVYVTNNKDNVSLSVTGGSFATKIGCVDASKLAGCITGGTFTDEAKANTNASLFA